MVNICQWPEGCENQCEGTMPYCGTHNQMIRKANKPKPEKKVYFIPNKSATNKSIPKKSNTFACSDGTRVTQDQIDRRRSEAYKNKYPVQELTCHCCWKRQAQGSAHLIPQARCKNLGKTELIWHPRNIVPACIHCNMYWETPKGNNWQNLSDVDYHLEFIGENDPELYQKFALNRVKKAV